MQYREIIFSSHAIRRIFERGLKKEDVIKVVKNGKKVSEYPEDQPFPSCLLLGFVGESPLHVVVAFDSNTQTCYVITAYEPDPIIWYDGFRKRRDL